MTNSGGILSTWLLGGTLSPPPKYTTASITLLVFQIAMFVCTALNIAYLMVRNKEKARARADTDISEEGTGIGDDSIFYDYNL